MKPMEKKRMNWLQTHIGGEELYNRFINQPLIIEPIGDYDVEQICKAKGITDKLVINKIKRSAKSCGYDMRTIAALIKKECMKQAAND